jgi:uncharacterized protein YebE (UPF0316 family)
VAFCFLFAISIVDGMGIESGLDLGYLVTTIFYHVYK